MLKEISFWIFRFIKYNMIGGMSWLANLGFYTFLFYPLWGEWGIIPYSISGAIIEFTALTTANKYKKIRIFDSTSSCQDIEK